MKILFKVGLLGLLLQFSGCAVLGGNFQAIHTSDKVKVKQGHARIVSTDVKQRSIFFMAREKAKNEGNDPNIKYVMNYCAEPPPDVLTAQSISASANITGQVAKSKDANLALQSALASQETAAAINRTQTVNLLRESMYRTCERYVNGLISATEVSIQAARDQRMATSILAIEQLTSGMRRPAQLIVSGAASANSGTASLSDKVEKLAREVGSKKVALDSAKAAYAKANTSDPTCDTRLAGTEPDASDKTAVSSYNQCKAARDKINTATEDLAQATEARDSMERIAAGGGAAPATASTTASAAGGTGDGQATTVSDRIAHEVRNIVQDAFREDDVRLGCAHYLFELQNKRDVTATKLCVLLETAFVAKELVRKDKHDGDSYPAKPAGTAQTTSAASTAPQAPVAGAGQAAAAEAADCDCQPKGRSKGKRHKHERAVAQVGPGVNEAAANPAIVKVLESLGDLAKSVVSEPAPPQPGGTPK